MNELSQLKTALAPDTQAAAKAYREILRSVAAGDSDIATVAEELSDCCEILDLSHETAVGDIESLREVDVITKRRRAFKRQAPKLQRDRDAIDEKFHEHRAIIRKGQNGLRRIRLELHRAGQPWNVDRADEARLAEIECNARLFDQPEADDD